MNLISKLDQLVVYFNRRVLNVPDDLLNRNTQFLLNGVAYETLLGRSPTDPLVRMITRGGAGYRFAATAVLHALESARLTCGDFNVSAQRASGTFVLSGVLRGTETNFKEVITVDLTLTNNGIISAASVHLSEEGLTQLRTARSA